jgi:hypothetical protein
MKIENREKWNIQEHKVKPGCCVDADKSKVYELKVIEVCKIILYD